MKKLILFSAIALFGASCGNSPKEEAVEQQVRDSQIIEKNASNESKVEEMMRLDSIREAQENAAKDSSSAQ